MGIWTGKNSNSQFPWKLGIRTAGREHLRCCAAGSLGDGLHDRVREQRRVAATKRRVRDDRDVVGGTEAHRLGLRAEGMELNLINLWPATNVVRHLTNFPQSVLGCIDASDSGNRRTLQHFLKSTRFAFSNRFQLRCLIDFVILWTILNAIHASFLIQIEIHFLKCIVFQTYSHERLTKLAEI